MTKEKLPLHDEKTFTPVDGAATGDHIHLLSPLQSAPPAQTGPGRPAVQRVTSDEGATQILMRFQPGQLLDDHKAAHPILLQVFAGAIEFTCGEETCVLTPGVIAHLDAWKVHKVVCPDDTNGETIMLLTMLTDKRTVQRPARANKQP